MTTLAFGFTGSRGCAQRLGGVVLFGDWQAAPTPLNVPFPSLRV